MHVLAQPVEFRLCRGTLLCHSMRASFTSRLDGCCSGGTVHAICFGPRGPNFIKTLWEFMLCRGTSFPSRLCTCGSGGAAICFGPRRSNSGSVVALRLAIPNDFTAAVAAALFLPFALEEGPEDTAISVSVVAPCFAIPGGRASPAGLAAAVTPALGAHDGPAPPEDTATLDSVVALSFAMEKPSFTITNRLCDCWDDNRKGCRGTVLCNPLFFAIPGSRASPSPTGFATVVPVAVALHFTSSQGTFPICSAVKC